MLVVVMDVIEYIVVVALLFLRLFCALFFFTSIYFAKLTIAALPPHIASD